LAFHIQLRSPVPHGVGDFALPGHIPDTPGNVLTNFSREHILMNTLTRRSLALTTAVLAAAGLAGCTGGDQAAAPTSAPAPALTNTNPALAGLVGSGCSAYVDQVPKGSGSVAGMSQDPLGVAVGHNPRLTMLTAALSGKLNKKVKLLDTLDANPYTVFAPVDDAFKQVSASRMTTLKTNSTALIKTLTYHVVAGRLDPAHVVGSQRSVDGGLLKVTRSGKGLQVNGANVLCGGVKTANATVYLIDQVLTPTK
jgi:uncharacterized surface protein with fasciclin (FAS1) repeats